MPEPVAETDRQQCVSRPFPAFRGGNLAIIHKRQFNVLYRRSLRQKVIVLEYKANLAVAQTGPLGLAHSPDRNAVQKIFPGSRRIQTAEDIEQSGFSGSRSSHDGNELSFFYSE